MRIKDTIAKQVLDPLRLRILDRLADGAATAAILLKDMGTSRPTLYRAIDQLHSAGLIAVEAERPVRGTVERTWRLAIDRDSLAALEVDPQMLLASLTSVFAAFVAAPAGRLDPRNDPSGVSGEQDATEQIAHWVRASSARIHVTGEEFESLRLKLIELLGPYLSPRPGARPLHLTLFTVPTGEES